MQESGAGIRSRNPAKESAALESVPDDDAGLATAREKELMVRREALKNKLELARRKVAAGRDRDRH